MSLLAAQLEVPASAHEYQNDLVWQPQRRTYLYWTLWGGTNPCGDAQEGPEGAHAPRGPQDTPRDPWGHHRKLENP